jgi:TonB family protein
MRPVAASGVESEEQLAWQGIATSGPFPPLPPEFKGDFLVLRFRFYYWPERADFLEICGQARATTKVEAETIGKDQRTDVRPYIEAKVLPLLRANWYRIITKSSAKSGGNQTIDFTILKNGDLGSAKTVETATETVLGTAALGAVNKSAPFPPLPAQFGGPSIGVRVKFGYEPDAKPSCALTP